MGKIALITDSGCDLSDDTLLRYNIKMLPFQIIFNKEGVFLDRESISIEEVYEYLHTEIPTTSLPNLEQVQNLFKTLPEEGYNAAVIVTVSSALSGTYNALNMLAKEHLTIPYFMFDSMTLGYPEGAIVTAVADMIEKSNSLNEIIHSASNIIKRTHGYVTLNTLENLIKGGRIGKVKGTIGEILNLKPIITYNEDGVLCPYCNTRGRKQSIRKLKEIIEEYLEKGPCEIKILTGTSHSEAETLKENFINHPNAKNLTIEMIGASMGIHTGRDALGVSIQEQTI